MKSHRLICTVALGLLGCGSKEAETTDKKATPKVVESEPSKPKSDEAAKKVKKIDITGSYTLAGETADGTAITGTLEVKALKGSSYLVARTENGKKLKGVMYRDGEHVFSAWSDKGAGLRTFTLNDDGSLDGTYFGNTETRMSKEVLQGGSAKMTGMYRIVNAAYGDGSAYRGTASITLKNDIYQASYQITDNEGRESFMAYGLRADNMLGVASHKGGPFGFAHYKIAEDGTLTGENGWSDAATAGAGKETLKK